MRAKNKSLFSTNQISVFVVVCASLPPSPLLPAAALPLPEPVCLSSPLPIACHVRRPIARGPSLICLLQLKCGSNFRWVFARSWCSLRKYGVSCVMFSRSKCELWVAIHPSKSNIRWTAARSGRLIFVCLLRLCRFCRLLSIKRYDTKFFLSRRYQDTDWVSSSGKHSF